MPIDVEDGYEDERDVRERALGRPAFQHFAQREQTCVLPVDLAGVDASLHQRYGALRAMCGGCIQHAVDGRNQR